MDSGRRGCPQVDFSGSGSQAPCLGLVSALPGAGKGPPGTGMIQNQRKFTYIAPKMAFGWLLTHRFWWDHPWWLLTHRFWWDHAWWLLTHRFWWDHAGGYSLTAFGRIIPAGYSLTAFGGITLVATHSPLLVG